MVFIHLSSAKIQVDTKKTLKVSYIHRTSSVINQKAT